MGLLSASGSLARVSGPVFVGWIYREYGTYLTMGLSLIGLVLGFVLMLFTYKRLVPFDVSKYLQKEEQGIEMEDTKL